VFFERDGELFVMGDAEWRCWELGKEEGEDRELMIMGGIKWEWELN
jgi:hypothetical protein